ncbi:MAG: hypothetical protein IH600_12545 [Bacteroidetes bacterium]|nr:hypothetical protein [Bacteroidota bacterium]
MKMRRLSILCVLPLLILTACSDDPEGTPTGRFVYYVNGDHNGQVEFHRYEIVSGKDERLSTDHVISLSEVAANGRVLFETRSDAWPYTYQLFGRCEGGAVIPVPLPLSSDPAVEFSYVGGDQYGEPLPAALAHGGHHAAFYAWQRPVGSTDTTEWKLHLCIFDCAAWKMSTTDISAFIENHFAQQGLGFRPDIPSVTNVLALTNDGSVAVISLIVRQVENGAPVAWRTLLLGGTPEQLRVLAETSIDTPLSWFLAAFESSGTLYLIQSDHSGVAYDCRGGSWQVALKSIGRGFQMLSAGSGEYGRYNSNVQTITLQRVSDGRLHEVPITRTQLETSFPDVQWLHGLSDWGKLSPDGEWIAFVAQHAADQGLYVIRRDGTGLRRIARGTFDVPPVVSDVVPY